MEQNTCVVSCHSNDRNRVKTSSRRNRVGESNSHTFKNIDLESLKNIINISSQGAQNTIHINICDQQNIININDAHPEVQSDVEKLIPAIASSPPSLHLREKTNPPQKLSYTSEIDDENRYLYPLNSFSSTRYPRIANDEYLGTMQAGRCAESNKLEHNMVEKHSNKCLESSSKISNERKKEPCKYVSSRSTFVNDLSDGATEISRTYLLRKTSPETISISKSINQLPSLTKPKPSTGTELKPKNNQQVKMQPNDMDRRRKTIAYNDRVSEKNRQFRRLSLSIQGYRGKSPPETLEKLQYGKTFDQWKAEKGNMGKKKREEMLERERGVKECELVSDARRKLIVDKYNEWLTKKHDNELKDEERRTVEMRKKWAAKGVRPHAPHNKQGVDRIF